MGYLVMDMMVNVLTFLALTSRREVDPKLAVALVVLVVALNVVGFETYVEIEVDRGRSDGSPPTRG